MLRPADDPIEMPQSGPRRGVADFCRRMPLVPQ
jgi:hypothetical protein